MTKKNLLMVSKTDNLFQLVKIDKDIRIICGDALVSAKKFKTAKAAEDYIATKPYELLINTSIVIFKKLQENENNQKETAKTHESAENNN